VEIVLKQNHQDERKILWKTCNAIGVPPSPWTWYEKFHNVFKKTPKLTGVVGGIDQSSCLPHPQVVNLDDHPNFIPKTQPLEIPKCQTLVFVDSNDHVTPNHTYD
jgi:hypothetical protein